MDSEQNCEMSCIQILWTLLCAVLMTYGLWWSSQNHLSYIKTYGMYCMVTVIALFISICIVFGSVSLTTWLSTRRKLNDSTACQALSWRSAMKLTSRCKVLDELCQCCLSVVLLPVVIAGLLGSLYLSFVT